VDGPRGLGVDVAADGGDEFVIARADGLCTHIVHNSTNNDNAVAVAGTVLEHIHRAQKDHADRGINERVRVKIDSYRRRMGSHFPTERVGQREPP
jgi:hypothetical protein